MGELGDGRGLADAVDAHHEVDRRRILRDVQRSALDPRAIKHGHQTGPEVFLHVLRVLQAALPDRRPEIVEDGQGRVDVDIRLEKGRLEILEQLLVDPAAPGEERVDLLKDGLDESEAQWATPWWTEVGASIPSDGSPPARVDSPRSQY